MTEPVAHCASHERFRGWCGWCHDAVTAEAARETARELERVKQLASLEAHAEKVRGPSHTHVWIDEINFDPTCMSKEA